jgi:plastocyanin
MQERRLSKTRGALSLAAACAALVLAAGCGSSSSTTTTVGAGAGSTSTTAGKPKTSSTSGGLKVDTAPKYATPSSSEPVQSGVVQIAYRNIAIDPDTVRVKVGTTIKWTNYDPVEHNVTSKSGPLSFASKDFSEGHAVEFKMTKPGIIHDECTIHPATMNGTIEVVQ